MKKLEKEAVLKERFSLVSAVSFFIFILPYVLHLAINGVQIKDADQFGEICQTVMVEMDGRKENIQLEQYLVGALARNSEKGYTNETLKAIAVVLRSNTVYAIAEGETVSRDSFYTDEELHILWKEEYDINTQRYREAVKSTEGIVLFYNGKIVKVPFHMLSSGKTRQYDEIVQQKPYLCSVESPEDMYAEKYLSVMEFGIEHIGSDFRVIQKDPFSYVIKVQVKGEMISGEDFCKKYGLPSACFEYYLKDDRYVFEIRGIGHGFGMSLYGANSLSQKGWSFAEILQYYYPGIEIRKENREDIVAMLL